MPWSERFLFPARDARLSEGNVECFVRRPAAHDASLRGRELAVLLVAQRESSSSPCVGVVRQGLRAR
jgi:hypothetical protein